MDKESATITFNSGRVSSMGSSNLEFKGVPLKEILGNMWDKYKKFKLVLNTHGGNFNSGFFNRQHSIRISGLPFINTTDFIDAIYGIIGVVISLVYLYFIDKKGFND